MSEVAVVTDSTVIPRARSRGGERRDRRPALCRLRRRSHRPRDRDHRLRRLLRGAARHRERSRPRPSRRWATSGPPTSRCWPRVARSSRSTSPAACPAPPRRRARPRRRSTREGKGGERIHVIDSTTAAGGLGFMVLAAAKASRDGMDGQQVAAHVTAAREELKMWFAVDTLEFLRRGGRIGAASAWIGSTLKVKPILTVENEMTPVERVRTSGRAFERMVDYGRQRRDSGRRRLVRPAHQRARSGRRAGRAHARAVSLRADDRQRDRPRARRPHRARAARHRRPAAPLRALSRRRRRAARIAPRWPSLRGRSCASC